MNGLLDRIDLFNLLCVPGETTETIIQDLEKFCRDRRAFLIADCAEEDDFSDLQNLPGNITGDDSINAAFYFPWVVAPDVLQENRPRAFPPSGFVAGLYARTDATRGIWKAPAGTEASLTGVNGVTINLTDNENGVLNPKAVNCIRTFSVYGTIVWGARTLQGNDERGAEWKYIPVRRTALFIQESLFRALKWVVFEPNDEPLWAQIRLNVGSFMHNLFRQGAFQGTTPKDAYFVKCDKETTTQNDVNLGIVNIVIGFAPLKPAEFVIIKLQQMAGQIEV
jgi:phage tail sheath protein FI